MEYKITSVFFILQKVVSFENLSSLNLPQNWKPWYQNQFQQLAHQEVLSKDLASLISWRLTEKDSLKRKTWKQNISLQAYRKHSYHSLKYATALVLWKQQL